MLHADPNLNPWTLARPLATPGGPVIVPRAAAPLGQTLPYRRFEGGQPAPGIAALIRERGWHVDLGQRGLGDVLLGLAIVRGLHEITHDLFEPVYQGPRPALIGRCELPLKVEHVAGPHVVHTATADPIRFEAIPEQPPTWLEPLDDGLVEVHAALPMRYYLALEQELGIRLPALSSPTPRFITDTVCRDQRHVVFVATTSLPSRKDYGREGFANIANELGRHGPERWQFTMLTSAGVSDPKSPDLPGIDTLAGVDAADCVEIFGSADLIIGNDTGLTHLAALTMRSDSSGPQVIGLYGRHAYNKWTTGSTRQHAIATPFSQMLAAADCCPVRDRLDDSLWGIAADIRTITPARVATFALTQCGWQ